MRSIARALVGDLKGAASDLEQYVAAKGPPPANINLRKQWIEALGEGKNPYTPEVLGAYAFQ